MSAHPTELQRLLAEAPFVRALAHQLLADEADDVVQQTFLKALQDHPAALARPRSWLARVVRNLVTDQRRRLDRRNARERAAAVAERLPSAAELVAAEESHRALVDAVNRLPGQLRTIVLLRYYEHLPPRRIAAALDLPVAVVWEQLRGALQQLRSRLDADHDRRAWLLPLVPVALQPRALPWRELLQAAAAPTLWTGVLAMKTKTMIVAALTVLVLTGTWALWPGAAPNEPPNGPGGAALLVARDDQARPDAGAVPAATAERQQVAPARSDPAKPERGKASGALEVMVSYADGSAARSVGVGARQRGKDPSHRQWNRTDERGRVVFDPVPEGYVMVTLDRALVGDKGVASVLRGETARLQLIIETKLSIAGTVLGEDNAPVAGADVVLSYEKLIDEGGMVVAQTDSAGRFELKTGFGACWVGARAKNHGASSLQRIAEVPDESKLAEVVIRLPPGGGLEGKVSRNDGTPVANAIIRVGRGDLDVIAGIDSAPPVPARSRSDDKGLYVVNGIDLGGQPVLVRAAGFAPWSGSCLIEAGKTCNLQITLVPESRVVGRVESGRGRGIPDVIVSSGEQRSLFFVRTATDQDGRFVLSPLAPGAATIVATEPNLGDDTADVELKAGEEKEVVLVLSRGGGVSGRVMVDDGTPLAGARVEFRVEEPTFQMFHATTRANGAFDLGKLPPVSGTLRVQHADTNEVSQQVTVPSDLILTLTRKRPGRVAIHGRVLASDGTAVRGATVAAQCLTSPLSSEQLTTDETGEFGFENLYEGRYGLLVQKGGFPDLRLPDRQLDYGDTWAVGNVVLVRGGAIKVIPRRPLASGIEVWIFYKEYKHAAYIRTAVSNLISEQVLPGECQVFITGKEVASEYHEVVVVAGQETVVEALCEKGCRRSILVTLPSGSAAPDKYISSFMRREGKLVALKSGVWKAGQCTLEYCLAPGVYEVELKSGAGGTKIPLTVGDQAEDAPALVNW